MWDRYGYRLGWVSGGGGGGGDVNYIWQATAALTDAQIKASPTTAVQVIAAPGAGKMLIFPGNLVSPTLVMTMAAVYTNVNAGAKLEFDLDILNTEYYTAADFFGVDWAPGAVWSPSIANGAGEGGTVTNPIQNTSFMVNAPLLFSIGNAGSGVLTGGHASNSLLVTIPHFVLDTTTGLLVPTA